MLLTSSLETYFAPFREGIIGNRLYFDSPYGRRRLLYADWAASGRAYKPIEDRLQQEVLPFFGNTHTESTLTGRKMSEAYDEARRIIRHHVNAGEKDVVLFCGSGMTSAVCKLQRILGMKGNAPVLEEDSKPLVLVTEMEHHSNHISWLETNATVEIIQYSPEGGVDLKHFRALLERYRQRRVKIAAVTACSNVTGIMTPYHTIASIIHEYGGWCFVDFSASAPYVDMDMHPGGDYSVHNNKPDAAGEGFRETHRSDAADLDAIYFSMHKFLGGPGTPGVLVFNRQLYSNLIPDHPGGGTLLYSNPWKHREYLTDIQQREDGGTPPILQTIKAGMCIQLKEEMGITRMQERETQLVERLFDWLEKIPGLQLLAAGNRQRLGIISFIIPRLHHDWIVQQLNDRYGIQARGGCSCAGTYGHRLLAIDEQQSLKILDRLRMGDSSAKPGWVRLSLHPTMTEGEMDLLSDAVKNIAATA